MRVPGTLVTGVLLAGCAAGPQKGDPLLDTGWFEDGPWDLGCKERLVEVLPIADATGWYWRTAPTFSVTEAWSGYQARVTTGGGKVVPTSLEASDDGLTYTVRLDGPLAPSTEHVLEVEDCEGRIERRFTTSDLGEPLDRGPSTVVGRTWQLDLARATWLEPGGFGPTLGGFLEASPILLGVRLADDVLMDWIGTNGFVGTGGVYQSSKQATWDFPVSDFDEAPYFDVRSEDVELTLGVGPLPIRNLRFTGTFAADGSRIGGATLSGQGDTRYAGAVAGSQGDPGAFCDLAAGLGVQCEACADGEPYCLTVEVVGLSAPEVPGLTLAPVVLPEAP